MNCTECQERLVDYLEGLLTEPREQMVKAHLRSCDSCRADWEQLQQLHQQLASSSDRWRKTDFQQNVANRIIREQHQQLKRVGRINRPLEIGRKIMHSKITKYVTAAATTAAVILMLAFFHTTTPVASAAEVLQKAIDAVADVKTVHMKARMRTLPRDNFGFMGLKYDFVPLLMWKKTESDGTLQWRIEKPGRVVVMDGKTTTFFVRPNLGSRIEKPFPLGCFDAWWGRLMNVSEILNWEKQAAKDNPRRKASVESKKIDGKGTLVLTVNVTTEVPEDDYLRNSFLMDSDHRKVYRFNPETKLLEGFQVYVQDKEKEVLVFEITEIEYNKPIPDKTFTIAFPEDMIWIKEKIEKLPDNEKYEKMTPKEAAQAFFEACAKEDWEEVLKFESFTRISDRSKKYLGGLEVISIGEPFQSKSYPGWYVPYEIKLKNGKVKKHNLAFKKRQPANRYIVDGGI